jgi:hypothetical protein
MYESARAFVCELMNYDNNLFHKRAKIGLSDKQGTTVHGV